MHAKRCVNVAWDGVGGYIYLLGGDGLLAGLSELLNDLLVVSQILLAANEDDGETLAEVQNLRDPLRLRHVSAKALSQGNSGRAAVAAAGDRTFSWTLSRESGESTAKQIRITWESG